MKAVVYIFPFFCLAVVFALLEHDPDLTSLIRKGLASFESVGEMGIQKGLILSSSFAILISLIACFFIQESKDKRHAKPYFIAFFVFNLMAFTILSRVPHFTVEWQYSVLKLLSILNITSLTVGLSIRFSKPFIEKASYFIAVIYLVFVLPFDAIAGYLDFVILVNVFLSIWAVVTRKPKVNHADFCFALLMGMWAVELLLKILIIERDASLLDFFNNGLISELISAPSFLTGIAIFLLTSYMLDGHTHVKHLANIDQLTNLLNRRALFDEVTERVEKVAQLKSADVHPSAIIIADIDHFKKINDTYGHQAGDMAIRQFADIIDSLIVHDEIAARYGGEEFLIFVPNANADKAALLANKIKAKTSGKLLHHEGKNIHFTASFGVVDFDYHAETETSIAKADKALYLSKEQGRNQVSVYQ